MPTTEEYLGKIKDLNIVPPVLMSVLTLDDDNELPFSELEKMVQSDQILVTRLLRLANSPFYSRGNRVQNIKQIIALLGFKTVRSMVALAFVDSMFSSGNYKKFRQEVWEHSIAAAIISQFLCQDHNFKKEVDACLLGGLLKELGKIALNTVDRKKYIEVLTKYQENGGNLLEIEKEAFGVNSVELGSAAAELWKLPQDIQAIISDVNLDITKQKVPVQLVTFASLLARKAGFGRFDESYEERYENYMELFGIPSEKRDEILEDYSKRLKDHELYKFCYAL